MKRWKRIFRNVAVVFLSTGIGVAVGYYFKVYKPKKAGEETPDEGLEEREDYETYEE